MASADPSATAQRDPATLIPGNNRNGAQQRAPERDCSVKDLPAQPVAVGALRSAALGDLDPAACWLGLRHVDSPRGTAPGSGLHAILSLKVPLRAPQTIGLDGRRPPADLRLCRADRTADLLSPFSSTKRGHRIRIRKLPLTCRVPLRNRTVDLLLTIDRRTVVLSLVGGVTRQNTSTDKHPQAPDRLSRALLAPRSAPQFDLPRSARRTQ